MPAQQTQQEAALFKAALAGKLDDVLRISEELGGDIKTFTDANGASCLHVAAHAGQTALCKHLVDDLQFDINAQDGGGAQPARNRAATKHAWRRRRQLPAPKRAAHCLLKRLCEGG